MNTIRIIFFVLGVFSLFSFLEFYYGQKSFTSVLALIVAIILSPFFIISSMISIIENRILMRR